MANGFGSQGNPYVEFPFDRITEVHWKTKPPPTELGSGQCQGGSDFTITGPIPPSLFNNYEDLGATGSVFFNSTGLRANAGHNWTAQLHGGSAYGDFDNPTGDWDFHFLVHLQDGNSGAMVGSTPLLHCETQFPGNQSFGPYSFSGAWSGGLSGGSLILLLELSDPAPHPFVIGGVSATLTLTALP